MRYVFLSIAILLMLKPLRMTAQNKISGLGKFKIGVTTIDSINGNNFNKIKQDYERVGTGINGLVEIAPFNPSESDPVKGAPVCGDSRVYYSAAYNIAGVDLDDLYLSFYKGILYKIECGYSDKLKNTLIQKYGPGTVKQTKQLVKCNYKLTGRRAGTYESGVTDYYWKNVDVYAVLHRKVTFDASCNMDEDTYFTITDTSQLPQVSICNQLAREKIKKVIDAKERKRLSEF